MQKPSIILNFTPKSFRGKLWTSGTRIEEFFKLKLTLLFDIKEILLAKSTCYVGWCCTKAGIAADKVQTHAIRNNTLCEWDGEKKGILMCKCHVFRIPIKAITTWAALELTAIVLLRDSCAIVFRQHSNRMATETPTFPYMNMDQL